VSSIFLRRLQIASLPQFTMRNLRPTPGLKRNSLVILLLACGGLSSIQPGAAYALDDSRPAYLRLVFNAEGQLMATAGCLSVVERHYAGAHWWSESDMDKDRGLGSAFKRVLAAIKNKDRESLLQLSAPSSRDPKIFDQQASAFFEQFSVLTVTEVPLSIQVDSLVIFFISVDYQGKVSKAPLVFQKAGENQFWFLPERSNSLEYALARDWFEVASKNTGTPSDSVYCTAREIERASYRIPVSSDAAVLAQDRSNMYLTGFRAGQSAAQGELTTRVQATLNALNASLAVYNGGTPLTTLTPTGAKRLADWWGTADANEHRNYVSAIVTQKPIFIFDLSPLIVVYTKSDSDVPRIMYFTPDLHGALLWTNSSYGTTFDRIFKDGPLYDAATQVPPFRSFSIQR
jgi:hypothetical protein